MSELVSTPGGSATLAGHRVARIGYGAMQLDRHRQDPEVAIRVLRHAIDHGVDHVDTAQFYGDGFVNSVIARAIDADSDVVIASKVGAATNPGGTHPMRPAQRPAELRAAVEDNLRALGRERLPLVNLRRLEIGPGLAATGEQIVDVDDQMAEMVAMRDEGKIGEIGISAVRIETVHHLLPAGIACVQNPYSVLDRRFESLLDLCLEHEMAWVPYFPLGSAFPGIPKVGENPVVIDIARDLDVTPAQVGLAWLLAHSPNTLLIPGTSDIRHLDANLAVSDITLSPESITTLDGLGAATTTAPIDAPQWPAQAH